MSKEACARRRSSSRFLARVLPGAKPAPFPGFIEPCLASLRTSVPSARGFVHELKLDGYRVQAHLRDGCVRLYPRSGLDWTGRFPTIAADLARLPAGKLVIDGEIISADAKPALLCVARRPQAETL
jgi:bifunctional non-homologous end joining protein LigD